MASNVVSDNFETGTGGVPQLGGTGATTCKAWVYFTGSGTVAIRDSFNVSSITDNGTGDFTINFSISFSDTNYLIISSGGQDSVANGIDITDKGSKTTNSVRMLATYNDNTAGDMPRIYTTIFSN